MQTRASANALRRHYDMPDLLASIDVLTLFIRLLVFPDKTLFGWESQGDKGSPRGPYVYLTC